MTTGRANDHQDQAAVKAGPTGSVGEVFLAFLRLGVMAFGGPVAHLAYFRTEFVDRRRWLSDTDYADMVALSQFMPGPASSQTGMMLGLRRAGYPGMAAAWVGFTTPSAVIMCLVAYGVSTLGALGALGALGDSGVLTGLKVAVVAVVADAVWAMAARLCPDRRRASLALVAAIVALGVPGTPGHLLAIGLGGIAGAVLLRALVQASSDATADHGATAGLSWRQAGIGLGLFLALLAGLPLAAALTDAPALAMIDAHYRAGALVFGGGHVVLPLLEGAVVETGWVTPDDFLAGYGAAQALPGPLFTFSAYLGAIGTIAPAGVAGGALALFAIFLPSALLVLGLVPVWAAVRDWAPARAVLTGVNAAVVGLLLAALYTPVWTSAVTSPAAFAVVLAAFGALRLWQAPSWLVVILGAGVGPFL